MQADNPYLSSTQKPQTIKLIDLISAISQEDAAFGELHRDNVRFAKALIAIEVKKGVDKTLRLTRKHPSLINPTKVNDRAICYLDPEIFEALCVLQNTRYNTSQLVNMILKSVLANGEYVHPNAKKPLDGTTR